MTQTSDEVRVNIKGCDLPSFVSDGEAAFALRTKLIRSLSEIALTVALISQRVLFGRCYCALQSDYFDKMPYRSGVYVRPLVTTRKVIHGAERPGDIDLLIIPYEGDDIVVSRTLALEIKAVRASFDRPGKSPNDMGFSQAQHLSELGFPFVGVAHLIVSHPSPPGAWKTRSIAQVIDESGQIGDFAEASCDWLPADLIDRSYGRRVTSCTNPNVGFVSAYLEKSELTESRSGHWIPSGRVSQRNPFTQDKTVEMIANYFKFNLRWFHEIPRYPWRSVPESEFINNETITLGEAQSLVVLGEVRRFGKAR